MNKAEDEYGPNWELVDGYLKEIHKGFLFENLGKTDRADATVQRIWDWGVFQEAMDYSLEDASPDNCRYLAFLSQCDDAHFRNKALAAEHGRTEHLKNAAGEASEGYACEVGGNEAPGYYRLARTVEPDYYWEASVHHHCIYIACEMVVADLTDVHLLRDMWYWYRAGHWPCGWEGEWPDGRLIVY